MKRERPSLPRFNTGGPHLPFFTGVIPSGLQPAKDGAGRATQLLITPLHLHRPRKQDVVLQVDMLVQVPLELV
jgi:hypothetical protein